jgi:hypothetical protein
MKVCLLFYIFIFGTKKKDCNKIKATSAFTREILVARCYEANN